VSRGDEPRGPAGGAPKKAATITLDLAPTQQRETPTSNRPSHPPPSEPVDEPMGAPVGAPQAESPEDDDDAVDYEALDFLPRGEG
jgi:hypothetical protein